jgi:alpha-1,2-mannosyltransferase
MWSASTGELARVRVSAELTAAFLPSSFAMYTTMLASSFWFHPATTTPTGTARATRATLCFAVGAIVGWPFTAVLGVPFVIEQLFLTGGEIAVGGEKSAIMQKRVSTLVKAVAIGASLAVSRVCTRTYVDSRQIPVYLIDSWAYGRSTFPTLNIITYNLFSAEGANLYGTSPSSFYLFNLFLNFNYLLPFALISLPGLVFTYFTDRRRLGKTQQAPKKGETSPYTLLALRLSPFYLWLVILTLQAHKEERFAFPAYPLLCFNAAVGIYLVRGWIESAFIAITKSPYRVSASPQSPEGMN